jgi:hypothetical protein
MRPAKTGPVSQAALCGAKTRSGLPCTSAPVTGRRRVYGIKRPRVGNLSSRPTIPLVKTELLALASVCEEIADIIEDHLTGGEGHAPRGPRLS